jgi:CRP/FNR family transcriptional regulator, cyclic AMP receptor protein
MVRVNPWEVPMHRQPVIDARLAHAPLFQGLSKRELRLVSARTTRLDEPAGRTLITEGAPGHEFIIVLDGQVEVWSKDRHLATRGPGEHLGEMALVEHQPRSATVSTTTRVTIDVISDHDFRALMDEVPALVPRIAAAITARRAEVALDWVPSAVRSVA